MWTIPLSVGRLTTLALACTSLWAQGASWPDYRGPSWNGHVLQAAVPLEWSERKNVSFKVPIPGKGWSSPVVHDGKIWLTTSIDRGKRLHVLAIDLLSGEVLHESTVFENEQPEHKNALNSYASPSPTIEQGRVYVNVEEHKTAEDCIAQLV